MTARIIALLAFALVAVPARPQQAGPASFDSSGVHIQYVDKGRGVPVVLLHGFTGSSARHWEAPGVLEALQTAGYRTIALDCRGHGGSGKPHDASQYGLEMVHDVVRLLDLLHIDRAHIVGYSMGGAIASQLLIRYPVRVRSATLLGAGWEGEDLREFTSFMNTLADGFAKRDASALVSRVTSGSSPSAAEIAAMSEALFARNDAEALAAVARAMPVLFDVPVDRLRAIDVPVLAIVGEHDTTNVVAVKRMAGVVRGLEVVELPGADHASSVRPSAKPLIAFLNKQTRN